MAKMLKFGKPKVTAVEAMNTIAKLCRDCHNIIDDEPEFNSPAEKFGYEVWKYLLDNEVLVIDMNSNVEGQQRFDE